MLRIIVRKNQKGWRATSYISKLDNTSLEVITIRFGNNLKTTTSPVIIENNMITQVFGVPSTTILETSSLVVPTKEQVIDQHRQGLLLLNDQGIFMGSLDDEVIC